MPTSIAVMLLLSATIFSPMAGNSQNKKPMTNQPEQRITALTEVDQKRLRDQRAVVEKHFEGDDWRKKYQTTAGKLGTIRALIEANTFQPSQTYELQCLGIVLGDAFVQELKMEWVIVEDEYGRDPAVRLPGTSIILYPLTMISKRLERGDKVDVFDLFNWAASQVEEMKKKGY